MIDKIKVKNLLTQLEVADTIEVAGEHENVQWHIAGDVVGDPENQVVLLTWVNDVEDSDSYAADFSTILTEQGLSDAQVSENNIYCEDHDGEEVHLRLWNRTPMACETNLKLDAQYSRMNVK